MPRLTVLAILIALLQALIVAPASAQKPAAPTRTAADCAKMATGTQADLNECYGQVAATAEAALAETIRKLTAKIADPAQKTLLTEAQRSWADYRDRECAFETAGTRGGTINPMLQSICRADKTRIHTVELQKQLNCVEGDLACAH